MSRMLLVSAFLLLLPATTAVCSDTSDLYIVCVQKTLSLDCNAKEYLDKDTATSFIPQAWIKAPPVAVAVRFAVALPEDKSLDSLKGVILAAYGKYKVAAPITYYDIEVIRAD